MLVLEIRVRVCALHLLLLILQVQPDPVSVPGALVGGRGLGVDVAGDHLVLGHEAQELKEAIDCKGVELALGLEELAKERLFGGVAT